MRDAVAILGGGGGREGGERGNERLLFIMNEEIEEGANAALCFSWQRCLSCVCVGSWLILRCEWGSTSKEEARPALLRPMEYGREMREKEVKQVKTRKDHDKQACFFPFLSSFLSSNPNTNVFSRATQTNTQQNKRRTDNNNNNNNTNNSLFFLSYPFPSSFSSLLPATHLLTQKDRQKTTHTKTNTP